MTLTLPQRLAFGLCISLTVLVIITFFYLITQWHSDWVLAHQAPPKTTVVATDETSTLIAALPESHLFGKAYSGEVPITNLQYLVTGIVKVENESGHEFSKAYVSVAGQASKIYQIGDEVSNGVKIYGIMPDAVILENDGKLEKLPLPREPLQFKAKATMEHS